VYDPLFLKRMIRYEHHVFAYLLMVTNHFLSFGSCVGHCLNDYSLKRLLMRSQGTQFNKNEFVYSAARYFGVTWMTVNRMKGVARCDEILTFDQCLLVITLTC